MEKKNSSPPTAQEVLEIINTQWANKNTIMKIACVGETKAWKIFHEIRDEVLNSGYKLPPNLVPMEKVVDYFNININYLKKVTK